MRTSDVPAPPVRASVAAGALAALVGAVSFWIFHNLWIAPVFAVLLEGLLWAAIAGAGIGWAFHHLHVRGRFPANWRGGLLLASLLWLTLIPFEIAGVVFGPLTHLTRPQDVLPLVPVAFLGLPMGALVGWALTHNARASLAVGVGVMLAHFMIGGSLFYFGGRGILMILFLAMLPTYVVAALAFVRLRAAFLPRPAGAPALEAPR